MPTQEEKDADDYDKGGITIKGLKINIENPYGSVRSGVSPDGKKWSNTLKHN